MPRQGSKHAWPPLAQLAGQTSSGNMPTLTFLPSAMPMPLAPGPLALLSLLQAWKGPPLVCRKRHLAAARGHLVSGPLRQPLCHLQELPQEHPWQSLPRQ